MFQKANPEKRKAYDKKDNEKPEKKRLMKELNKIRRENGKLTEWQRNNPDKMKIYRLQHRNHSITSNEWDNCKNYFNYRCAYCSLKIEDHYVIFRGKLVWSDFHREHVDHKGENDLSNCIPACKSCNCSKHTHGLEDWYNESNENYKEERLHKINQWINKDFKKFIDN